MDDGTYSISQLHTNARGSGYVYYPSAAAPQILDCAKKCTDEHKCQAFSFSSSAGCGLASEVTAGANAGGWGVYMVTGYSSRAIDDSIATCALLKMPNSWLQVDLDTAATITAVVLLTAVAVSSPDDAWELRVAQAAEADGHLCISSLSPQIARNPKRSSACAIGNDRVEYSGACGVSWDAELSASTLPEGRYVKVLQQSQHAALKVCDLKVFGIPPVSTNSGAVTPAAAGMVSLVNYPDGEAFQTEFGENFGLDAMESILVSVSGTFTIAAIDAGSYMFNLISSDGSVLFIDSKLVVNNDGVHGTLSTSGGVNLGSGQHKLTLLYFKRRGGTPVLSLKWGGGPHGIGRQVFEFEANWNELRVAGTSPTCLLKAPDVNDAGVQTRYGLSDCHGSCASCLPGTSDATQCTTCKEQTPHHTILNPRYGTGMCTDRLCPLCKPKECCSAGHRHFILDAKSRNGVCLKHTDDCKAHCVNNSIFKNGLKHASTGERIKLICCEHLIRQRRRSTCICKHPPCYVLNFI